jgi:hypothetical protein
MMPRENPYKSPHDSEYRPRRNWDFVVRAALYFHIAATVNFVIYGMLVIGWTLFGWATNPVFAVYVECSSFLAVKSFLFMPVIILLLVIFLPLSLPAGKRTGIVLASLGLNVVIFVVVMLLMPTPDFGR